MGIPFRFIQCGDLHLGAPFRYLKSFGRSLDEAMMRATYGSFQNIVNLAIRQRVAAVLITGDIYDGAEHPLEAEMHFVRGCESLDKEHIAVYIVQGNHDPAESWKRHMPLPKNVHIFSSERVERVPLLVRGQEVAAIYGRSISSSTQYDDLTSDIHPLRSDPFSIALVHGTVGSHEGHDRTGPCSVDVLRSIPIQYWAFGHIHKRQIISENPHIVYAGNSQGLHRGESGPKGCYVVDVSSRGTIEARFHETNVIRFAEETIDLGQVQSVLDMQEMLRHKKEMLRKPGISMLLSIRLTGQGPLLDIVRDAKVRAAWMEESQSEESGKHGVYIIDINCESLEASSPGIAPGMVRDYVQALDAMHTGIESLEAIVKGRPEWKRLGSYSRLVTDTMLQSAYDRARGEGIRLLQGNDHED